MNSLVTVQINDSVYRFQDNEYVDAYLVCGKERAVVIDGLDRADGLYEKVKEITDLPLTMLLTHGHPDHVGKGMQEFMEAGCEIYISPKDYHMLEKMYGERLRRENIKILEDGMLFDLGMSTLRAMAMPGHTQGSVLFYMKEKKILFSSDAIGSGGIWMQLPESSPLTVYVKEVKKLYHFLEENESVKIYPGHSKQIPPYLCEDQNYLDREYVKDLIEMTEAIIAGKVVGEQIEIPLEELKGIKVRKASGKLVKEYCYNADALT